MVGVGLLAFYLAPCEQRTHVAGGQLITRLPSHLKKPAETRGIPSDFHAQRLAGGDASPFAATA